MTPCDQQYLIVDYFFDELSKDQKKSFNEHLAHCETCQQQLYDLTSVTSLVKPYKRKKPENKLLKDYHSQLQANFFVENKFRIKIKDIVEKFILRPTPALRLAEAFLFLIIGIFIGKMTIWRSDIPESLFPVDNNIAMQTDVDDYLLKNYLQKTEMILLDIANLDPMEDQKIISSLIQAANYNYLLQKTILLNQQAQEINDERLTELLNQIELVLLELCNIERNAMVESLSEIKQQMNETHLLLEIKAMNDEINL